MPLKVNANDAKYYLGFDGGGTKTDCILADADGGTLARASAGPSNPLRTGYTRAWFSLSEAADTVLGKQKLHAGHIRGVCAGLGGAGRTGVARRVTTFLQRSYPNAQVRVTTDLEIALEAAFGTGEGIILLAGTGSAAFGRDAGGRTARAGGRGPWISDEGSAFAIGRKAIAAVVRAEEHRGPATSLAKRLFKWHQCRDWDALLEQIAKNPDDVFPKTFPLVAELADAGDAIAGEILSAAATRLAELAVSVANELGWRDRDFSIARVGGVYGRSKAYDGAILTELKRTLPRGQVISTKTAPAEAAAQIAIRFSRARGNAA
jgi:N-acetylglucosamine kinase-like BadF-type ATPase